MQTEKRPPVSSLASPRWLWIGLSAGVLLALVGLGLQHVKNSVQNNLAATPPPTATPTASALPSASPTASPTATPSPSPSASPASISEARADYQAKQYSKAIPIFVQAVKEAQGAVAIAELQYELANAYRDNNQTDLALSTYALAIAQNPKLVVAYEARANVLISLGRRDEAGTTLQSGIDANPGNQDLQRDLSVLNLNGPSN